MTSTETALLISDIQAAALLGISRVTFRRWHAIGNTPEEIRFGGSTRWHKEELVAWIAAGCPKRRIWQHSKERKAIRG